MVDIIYLVWYVLAFCALTIIAIVYVKNRDDNE